MWVYVYMWTQPQANYIHTYKQVGSAASGYYKYCIQGSACIEQLKVLLKPDFDLTETRETVYGEGLRELQVYTAGKPCQRTKFGKYFFALLSASV